MIVLGIVSAATVATALILRSSITTTICYLRWLSWSRKLTDDYGADAALRLIDTTRPVLGRDSRPVPAATAARATTEPARRAATR